MATADQKDAAAGNEPKKGFLASLGLGLITGASDDDPSGIATYSQAGAAYGLGLLWSLLLTYPLMDDRDDADAPQRKSDG
jgi:Mn2+/Fe2+ NRAMP family transporter